MSFLPRKVSVFIAATGMAAINLVTYSSAYASPTELANMIQPKGCVSGPRAPAPSEIFRETRQALVATSVDCSTCTQVGSTSQNWCRDLTGGCSDWFPWHTNFEWERTIKFFSCPNNVTGIRCDGWRDSGCCGTDDKTEPKCGENSEVACTAVTATTE